MDDILDWARANGGLFTTRQAARHGLDAAALSLAVRRGTARRIAQGVYALGPRPATAEARHRELCRGLLLLHPDAVLAGRSAVLAHSLPLWSVPLQSALLMRDVPRQRRRSGAVVRPPDRAGGPVDTPLGPAEPAHVAVVRLALDHGAVPAVVALDAALARGRMTLGQLDAEIARRSGHRRVQQALAARALCDLRSESPGETRLRVILAGWGMALEPQFVVRDGERFVARVDLRVAGTRVLIEFDGLVKYTDGGVEALVREKRREDRLRALGWTVIRFTWRDLDDPARVIDTVRRAVLRDAALRAG